jgi:hypothetical protein
MYFWRVGRSAEGKLIRPFQSVNSWPVPKDRALYLTSTDPICVPAAVRGVRATPE